MANIIICGECSGQLRRRFRAMGHQAYSADFKEAEDGEKNYHYQSDFLLPLQNPPAALWDLVILHPHCTAVTVAGNGTYAKGKPGHYKRIEDAQYIYDLWVLAKKHSKGVLLENPIGVLNSLNPELPRPQIIQPYDYGDNASKATCLWRHNLPRLNKTKRIAGRRVFFNGSWAERWDNQTDSGQNKLTPSPERATERARTYDGIADAIATQYGFII